MQTPFDETLFEAVDEQGRVYTCRALLCFERENKFFVLYVEEGSDPVPESLRAGYCDASLLEEGATVQLLPLENSTQWDWIRDRLKQEIENFLRDMFLMAQDDAPDLYFDDVSDEDAFGEIYDETYEGSDMDFARMVENYILESEDAGEERDLYAPDADGNYLS